MGTDPGNFNPRSPHGERRQIEETSDKLNEFQSTLPARGATLAITMRTFRACYFNPRSPHGERRTPRRADPCGWSNFNPRSPHGERRAYHTTCDRVADHFNPRSPHGERRQARREEARRRKISIHAPRTGSDADAALRMAAAMQFQSTLPARGATDGYYCEVAPTGTFQSTLPARGATCHLLPRGIPIIYFNPRSPHGERLFRPVPDGTYGAFQSTLPARGATASIRFLVDGAVFQSTLPARGATFPALSPTKRSTISIHAPRTGSDNALMTAVYSAGHFNPRSPHGERHTCHRYHLHHVCNFNPRSPHGERPFPPRPLT